MGYTHYWTLARPITAAEVAALAGDVDAIIDQGGVPVAYEYDSPLESPQLDEEAVQLNGIGEDGHETFYIPAGSDGFAFCKTAAKPYDIIVVASLLALKDRLKEAVKVSSDGDPVRLGRWLPAVASGLGQCKAQAKPTVGFSIEELCRAPIASPGNLRMARSRSAYTSCTIATIRLA